MKKSRNIFTLFLIVNLYSVSTLYAINPQRNYVATPEAIGVKYRTQKIKVNDGVTLNSWLCLQEDLKKPYIIISGADAGNMANTLGQTEALYKAGYNVILYDYRGFGESSDFEMNPDMVYYKEFGEDLKAVISFVKNEFKPREIFLYGLSMGTIVSRMNVDTDKAVKGLILDSFVIDPKLVKDRIYAAKKRELLLPEGSDTYARSNGEKLKKPALIFSGLQDMFTKTDDYKEFLSRNPSAKLVTGDCNHLECFMALNKDSNLYVKEINNFIEQL